MEHVPSLAPLGSSDPKIRKGLRNIEELYRSGQFSLADIDYAIARTDPFHDTPLPNLQGVPDGYPGKSVVHSVVLTSQISRPAGFTEDVWSVMLTSNPLLNSVILGTRRIFSNTVLELDTGPYNIGPVNFSFADGTEDFADNYFNGITLEPDADYLEGACRCIGMGIEVENTTAVLNLQGAFQGATMNQAPSRLTTCNQVGDNGEGQTFSVPASFFEVLTPPKNLVELSSLPDNVMWRASEGAYSVVRLKPSSDSMNSLPTFPLLTDHVLPSGSLSFSDPAQETLCYTPLTNSKTFEGIAHPANIRSFADNILQNPQDMTIMMFTGLSPETTLKVRVRMLLERFPSDAQADIVNLAKNPPSYNPLVFEVVDRLLKVAPAAVPFRENASGDWWKKILSFASDVVSPALSLIPHPLAQGAAAAINAGTRILNPVEEDEEKKLIRALLNEYKKGKIVLEHKKSLPVQSKGPPTRAPAPALAPRAARPIALKAVPTPVKSLKPISRPAPLQSTKGKRQRG